MRVTCKTGGESIHILPEDANRDPHTRMDEAGCGHCADGHGREVHCGRAASACGGEHDGPCWNPPPPGQPPGEGTVPDRPAGCAVCRPLLIEPMDLPPWYAAPGTGG